MKRGTTTFFLFFWIDWLYVVVVFLILFVFKKLRKEKIVAGSLMKALMRPGGGDSGPSDGHQVCFIGMPKFDNFLIG
jgi:hypothetical protein